MAEPEREVEWRRRYQESLDRQLALVKERDALAQQVSELRVAAREYVKMVDGWFDFSDTDAYDELNAALVHADRALMGES